MPVKVTKFVASTHRETTGPNSRCGGTSSNIARRQGDRRAGRLGPRMRVLRVEDDSATAQSSELMLKFENFNVYTTDLVEESIDVGKLYIDDTILLDLSLPVMSGYEVLRTLRVAKVKTPILILSGLAAIEDKIKGLGIGADDY